MQIPEPAMHMQAEVFITVTRCRCGDPESHPAVSCPQGVAEAPVQVRYLEGDVRGRLHDWITRKKREIAARAPEEVPDGQSDR